MNNTLCLGIFAALVYLRDLKWYYSAGQSISGDKRLIFPYKKHINKTRNENQENHKAGDTWQLLNLTFEDKKISADLEVCYPLRPNSSYPTKVEFNNCSFIHSKYFPILKAISPFCSLLFCSPKIVQPHPQVFSVNCSITCRGLHF